jgi:hypothetical protein
MNRFPSTNPSLLTKKAADISSEANTMVWGFSIMIKNKQQRLKAVFIF